VPDPPLPLPVPLPCPPAPVPGPSIGAAPWVGAAPCRGVSAATTGDLGRTSTLGFGAATGVASAFRAGGAAAPSSRGDLRVSTRTGSGGGGTSGLISNRSIGGLPSLLTRFVLCPRVSKAARMLAWTSSTAASAPARSFEVTQDRCMWKANAETSWPLPSRRSSRASS
jgi:hypothetical protein